MSAYTKKLVREARAALSDFAKRYGAHFPEFDPAQVKIEVWEAPHRPGALPPGHQAVMAFYWPARDRFLYVSLAGPNSNARYQSQHYAPGGSPSNLAKRILGHKRELYLESLDELSVGPWMRKNLARVNFLFPAEWDRETIKTFKEYLKRRWKPLLGG